jgi:hypothetical protein
LTPVIPKCIPILIGSEEAAKDGIDAAVRSIAKAKSEQSTFFIMVMASSFIYLSANDGCCTDRDNARELFYLSAKFSLPLSCRQFAQAAVLGIRPIAAPICPEEYDAPQADKRFKCAHKLAQIVASYSYKLKSRFSA